MTWAEFNDIVRTYLLVDSQRKGRGIQEYIDRYIVSGVIDMQSYVPSLRQNQYKFYSNSSTVEPQSQELSAINSEDLDVEQGDFPTTFTRINQIVVRRIPTDDNGLSGSVYYYPRTIPWETRFTLIDGGIVERTTSVPGRITFGENKFWAGPKLRDDEVMYIYYEGDNHHKPIYQATTDQKAEPVVYDERVAAAVADYVKARLAKVVDNDLKQYQTFFQMYSKERALIHIDQKDYKSSSVEQIDGGIGSSNFTIQ
jgi:hypothetical protein